jgi:hypothetical protein
VTFSPGSLPVPHERLFRRVWSVGVALLGFRERRRTTPSEMTGSIGTAIGSRHRAETLHSKIDLWPHLCYDLKYTKENGPCGTKPREQSRVPLPPFGRQRHPRARRGVSIPHDSGPHWHRIGTTAKERGGPKRSGPLPPVRSRRQSPPQGGVGSTLVPRSLRARCAVSV